jgi:hypothetical protein
MSDENIGMGGLEGIQIPDSFRHIQADKTRTQAELRHVIDKSFVNVQGLEFL